MCSALASKKIIALSDFDKKCPFLTCVLTDFKEALFLGGHVGALLRAYEKGLKNVQGPEQIKYQKNSIFFIFSESGKWKSYDNLTR